jgi:proteasome lid subunit RPN8/RPN11
MITISAADYERMVAHAKSELPDEACGLIAGTVEGSDKHIKEVYCLTNLDHSNEHFSLDPREQLSAIRDMRARGLRPLGNWHSHPETPARMSEEDKRLAHDSSASYLILSLMEPDHPVLHAFSMVDGESQKEELHMET